MNWAIESNGQTDYLPGEPWNISAEIAEEAWRKARNLHFLPVTVRRTTADEDRRLGSMSSVLNSIGKRKEVSK